MQTDSLYFFDSKGNNLNLSKDQSGIYTGIMVMDSVSVGLYSSAKIIILEEVSGDFLYPSIVNGESIEFVFEEDTEEKYMSFFKFDSSFCPAEDSSSLVWHEYSCPPIYKSQSLSVFPAQSSGLYPEINICFCNDGSAAERTFMRKVDVFYKTPSYKKHIAKIDVYCECIDEDKRLKAVAGNLGYDIFEKDTSIFCSTDIKESLPDFDFLNKKRKEIILEGHNIYPYIGSYRALLNVLKYFGYSDLTVREWWKNINPSSADYQKSVLASTYSLSGAEKVISYSGRTIELPNKEYKKTNRIALCWNVNKIDADNYVKTSQYSLPPQKEVYAFTIEEILIKLYNLKRKLEEHFLPVNVNIRDIIGEISSVSGLVASHHGSTNRIEYSDTGNKCNFSLDTEYAYIEDLRPFMTFPVGAVVPSGNVTLEDIQSLSLSSFNTDYTSYPAPVSGNIITGAEGMSMSSEDKDLSDSSIYPDSWFSQECANRGMVFKGGAPIDISSQTFGGLYSVDKENPYSCYQWTFYRANTNLADNFYLAHYSRYFPNLKYNSVRANSIHAQDKSLPDDENAVCGALVYLKCDCGEVSWDRCSEYNWNICKFPSWDTCSLYINNISRVQWTIVHDDTSSVVFDVTGEIIKGYGDITAVLPKTGSYSIQMRTWDWHNNISESYKVSCITVLPKNVEISGWFVNIDSEATIDSLESATYDSLDRSEFIPDYALSENLMSRTAAKRIDGSTVSKGAFVYENLEDALWNDFKKSSWESVSLLPDILSSIIIDGFVNGIRTGLSGKMLNVITYDNRHFAISLDYDDINSLAGQLNSLRTRNDIVGEILSMFEFQEYTPSVFPGREPQLTGVCCKGNPDNIIKECRVCDIQYVSSMSGDIVVYDSSINEGGHYNRSEKHNPHWGDIDTLKQFKTIPKFTSIVLDYTKSKIVSKQNPHWKIVSDNGFSLESDKKIFHHVFSLPGCYTAELSLSDRNGNTYTGMRRIFAIK